MMAAVASRSPAATRRRPPSVVAGALVKATAAALLPFMLLARRKLAADPRRARRAGARPRVVGYAVFGIHGIDLIAALNRDAAFVSTDSFPTEIAHLFGKPGVFPIDHDLLKAALVLIVVHLLWRTWRGYDWVAASGWTLLAIAVTSTWLLPWYTLWSLPLAVVARDRRLLVATLAVQALFIVHQIAPLLVPVSMSDVPSRERLAVDGGRWERLPEWLRPREHERRGRGDLRRVESDAADPRRPAARGRDRQRLCSPDPRQQRLTADLRTWRDAHRPRLPEHLDRTGPLRPHHARRRLRQHDARAPEERAQVCLHDDRAGRPRRRAVARRLVSAAVTSEDAPLPLRLLRHGDAAELCGKPRPPPPPRAAPRRARGSAATAGVADARRRAVARAAARGALPAWWPLAALTLLAAALRLSRSICRASGTTRRSRPCTCCTRASGRRCARSCTPRTRRRSGTCVVWAVSRVFGTGEVALRLPSALAGIATVPVAWAIGRELAGHAARTAIACRGARRGEPAVRVVLAGGARVRRCSC